MLIILYQLFPGTPYILTMCTRQGSLFLSKNTFHIVILFLTNLLNLVYIYYQF